MAATVSVDCCRWRSEHGLRRRRAMDGMSVAAAATVGSHREAARTTSTRRAVAVQIRLMTDFTGEDFVERRAWPDASAPACPETTYGSRARYRPLPPPPTQPAVPVSQRIRATAEPGLSDGGGRPELAINLDSALGESTDSRRHLASEGWTAQT